MSDTVLCFLISSVIQNFFLMPLYQNNYDSFKNWYVPGIVLGVLPILTYLTFTPTPRGMFYYYNLQFSHENFKRSNELAQAYAAS